MAALAAAGSGTGGAHHELLTRAVAGGKAAPTQLELWARHVALNEQDWRGETMLHAAIRGLEPGDESRRSALVSWLLEQGGTLLDGVGGDGASSSALQLLVARATSATDSGLDAACAALTRGTRFVVRSARGGEKAQDHSVWLSSDRKRLQWRVCRGAGSTQVAPDGVGVFTYFVNVLRVGDRETPYSMVCGIGPLRDGAEVAPSLAALAALAVVACGR